MAQAGLYPIEHIWKAQRRNVIEHHQNNKIGDINALIRRYVIAVSNVFSECIRKNTQDPWIPHTIIPLLKTQKMLPEAALLMTWDAHILTRHL